MSFCISEDFVKLFRISRSDNYIDFFVVEKAQNRVDFVCGFRKVVGVDIGRYAFGFGVVKC